MKFLEIIRAKRFPKRLQVALAVLFLVLLTLSIGWLSEAFTGFPKGYDSFDHLALGQIIKENFPHIFWNPYWDEGVVLFPRNYPPLFHFLIGLLAKAFSLEVTQVAIWILAGSICLTAIFIFLTIFFLTRKTLGGLFGAVFYLASSAVWCQLAVDGIYPRVMAMMTVSLVVLALAVQGRNNRTDRTDRTYWLLVLAFVLAYLTHFLAAVLATFSFLVILFSQKKKIIEWSLKVFLPVFGLIAFYYLPVLVLRPGKLGLIGGFRGGQYTPLAFLSLFRQGYPGLPFLSLPLGLLVLVLTFLLRHKIRQKKKKIYNYFLAFAALSGFCLLYVLGGYGRFFYGIYPGQFFLPSVFFLSLFLSLGLFFLDDLKIIKKNLFILLLIGLLAISLNQTTHLKKIVIDQSRAYSELRFKGIDEERLFRFGHRNEILGGAYNFYSQTLQTRGYYEPGIVHPDLHWWFEEAVFGQNDNSQETEFFLDWYSVKGLFVGGLRKRGRSFSLFPKLSPDDFARKNNNEWVYKKASPLLEANNTPVVWVTTDKAGYQEILEGLAGRGLDSQVVIPLWANNRPIGEGKEFPTVSSWPEMEAVLAETVPQEEILKERKGQKASFVNSQRRQIKLEEKFSGVLLRESYFPNWKAYVERLASSGERLENLPIYLAGPGMMYAFLPDYEPPARVVFEYQISWLEKFSFLVSALTLGWMIVGMKKGFRV